MSFLNPAVLFGLIAASIPVLLHLLNLRKLRKIDFSTLQFLKELQKNKIRRIKLKQWLLLALRVLIVIFIVIAFARPTLEGVSIGGTTSAAKTTALFILDDTFSMSVFDQKGSYFNRAKQAIKDILDRMQEGDEAAIILVSHQPEEINLTADLEKIAADIDDFRISFVSRELNDAIVKAAEIIGASQNFNKEIYLLSDLQKGRFASDENLIDLSELLNEQVRFYLFRYSGREIENAGISKLKLGTQIFEKNKPIMIEAEVTNFSSAAINNLVVSLFIEDNRSAQQSLDLGPGETKTATLEAPTKTAGLVEAFVEIEEDDILQDNKRFTSFYIPEKVKILILAESNEINRFIRLALQSGGTNGLVEVSYKDVKQAAKIQLRTHDVIFINSSNFNSIGDNLKDFLSNGKGVVIFPSPEGSKEEFNLSLNSLELPNSTGIITLEKSQTAVFNEIDFNHPLFENIFLEREKKQVESPQIISFHNINSAGKGRDIIKLINGSSFLSEYRINGGRVLLFNSSADLKWNDFPIKSIFAPLLNKIALYLSSGNSVNVEQTAGEKINLNVSERTLPHITIIRADDKEDFINLNENVSSDFLTYKFTEQVGNYKFFSGEKLLSCVSINTNPLESVTEFLSEEELENYFDAIKFQGSYLEIDQDENPIKQILQARFGSELWRYFLIGAFILALLEMAVARNVKKEIVELAS